MELITILFITDDLDYARALSTCVAVENSKMFFTIISSEDFYHYPQKDEYKLILVDYMIKTEETGFIILVEVQEPFNNSNQNQHLYRYDTAERLSQELMLLYCKKTGSKFIKPIKGSGQTVFFCSATGGTGKTSVALGLAQELVRFHGKRVLYINYEEFQSTDKYFRPDEEKSLDFYLYYMETNNNLCRIIDSFIITDSYGICTFSGSKGRNPLKLLNVQEMDKFMEMVQQAGSFDFILIDGDSSLNEETLWLISACDKICNISSSEIDIKQIHYNNYLVHSLGRQIFDKTVEVINFYPRETEAEFQEFPEKIYIDYDTDSFYTRENDEHLQLITINIEKEFGDGIKRLSEKLTLNLQ